jgi:thiosulfate/3-mercaptopyruvate sulfurtransferase
MTSGPGGEDHETRTAAMLLRVWSEPDSPLTLRARLVDADGPHAGATFSTAVGDPEIGREVLRWLERVKTGRIGAEPPAPAVAAPPPLVSTSWLAAHRDDAEVAVLQVGDRRDRPESRYLPGAGWLDWVEDLQQPDRRGVVGAAGYGAVLDRLGVGWDTHVVLCGGVRPLLAASAYWCFAYYGHPRVSILDGGVPRWAADGRELTDSPLRRPATAGYRAGPGRRGILVTRDQLLGGLVGAPPGTALVDCRSREEFAGRPQRPYDTPTDRHRMAGHIPGARNLPAEDLLDADGLLLDAVHIGQLCAALELRAADQVVVYCGANDRSALVWFALTELLGWPDVRCYYGAWSEYGSLTDVTVARGT